MRLYLSIRMFFGVMNRQYFRNIVESVLREYLEEGSFEDTHDSDEEMYDDEYEKRRYLITYSILIGLFILLKTCSTCC